MDIYIYIPQDCKDFLVMIGNGNRSIIENGII